MTEIITQENFDKYFRDARRFKAEKGEILAKYSAIAEFVEGEHKRDIINLLKIGKAQQASQVMNRIHGAKIPWCYSVPREMSEDLLVKSEKEVEEKPYEMLVEFLFWTKKEFVPDNDPHWEIIPVIKYVSEKEDFAPYIE